MRRIGDRGDGGRGRALWHGGPGSGSGGAASRPFLMGEEKAVSFLLFGKKEVSPLYPSSFLWLSCSCFSSQAVRGLSWVKIRPYPCPVRGMGAIVDPDSVPSRREPGNRRVSIRLSHYGDGLGAFRGCGRPVLPVWVFSTFRFFPLGPLASWFPRFC